MLRLSAAAALLILAGCGGSPPALDAMAGTAWTVERIVVSDTEIVRGEGESVTFGLGGTVSVSSCNQCSGRARLVGGDIAIEPELACTKRACGPGVTQLEGLLAGRTLRRDGVYLIADGPSEAFPDRALPTVVLLQTP